MKVEPVPPQAMAADDGQVRTLEEGFARWQAELLGTLFYVVGNVEDARDALQETFLKCWRRRDELPAVVNLRAWIFCVAVNTGRDLRRAAWRRKRLPLLGDPPMPATKDSNGHADLERQEQLGLVRRALADLRTEEQDVFLLRQNGELTYEEIARTLDIPVNTAKTRMRLALTKLRAVLGPE
ncbi:MAG TPA: RNA polymerase sigma factor [Planctomycetaceae bacterium]|nr:RNA polymerase sigma factor [Planctomycetaceae bacterium]